MIVPMLIAYSANIVMGAPGPLINSALFLLLLNSLYQQLTPAYNVAYLLQAASNISFISVTRWQQT